MSMLKKYTEAYYLMQRLIEDPMCSDPENGNHCHFCEADEDFFAPRIARGIQVVHEADCPWIEAMTFTQQEIPAHHLRKDPQPEAFRVVDHRAWKCGNCGHTQDVPGECPVCGVHINRRAVPDMTGYPRMRGHSS